MAKHVHPKSFGYRMVVNVGADGSMGVTVWRRTHQGRETGDRLLLNLHRPGSWSEPQRWEDVVALLDDAMRAVMTHR